MTKFSVPLFLMMTLSTGSFGAIPAQRAGNCDQFLQRTCTAAERASFASGAAVVSTRIGQRAGEPQTCDVLLKRTCTAPERAAREQAVQSAAAVRATPPRSCDDFLKRSCTPHERSSFLNGWARAPQVALN